VKCGVDPDDFWDSSLRHTLLSCEGFIYRQELDAERRVTSAWLTAAWQRAKRMPSLRSVVSKVKRRAPEKPVDKAKVKADFDQMVDEMTGDLNIKPTEQDG
jgi:hypothetical protein